MQYKYVILPISYFGPILHYSAMAKGHAIIEQSENYQKRSVRNKANILTANGSKMLTVPLVKGKNKQTPIREVRIANHEDWRKNHCATIRSAYGSAPYFDYYFNTIVQIICHEHIYLYDYNMALIKEVLDIVNVQDDVKATSHYDLNYPEDVIDLRYISETGPIVMQPYNQVFEDKFGFTPNLSIIDLLFNKGPEAILYLKNIDFGISAQSSSNNM